METVSSCWNQIWISKIEIYRKTSFRWTSKAGIISQWKWRICFIHKFHFGDFKSLLRNVDERSMNQHNCLVSFMCKMSFLMNEWVLPCMNVVSQKHSTIFSSCFSSVSLFRFVSFYVHICVKIHESWHRNFHPFIESGFPVSYGWKCSCSVSFDIIIAPFIRHQSSLRLFYRYYNTMLCHRFGNVNGMFH